MNKGKLKNNIGFVFTAIDNSALALGFYAPLRINIYYI